MLAESDVSLSVATGAVSLLTAEGPASRAARTHTPTPSYKGGGANHRERRTPPPVLPVLTTPQTPNPCPACSTLPCATQTPDASRQRRAVGRHLPLTHTLGKNAAKKTQVEEYYVVSQRFEAPTAHSRHAESGFVCMDGRARSTRLHGGKQDSRNARVTSSKTTKQATEDAILLCTA